MVLVDTSVWVDHLRNGNSALQELLLAEEIAIHSFVLCELACGRIKNRVEVFSLLRSLPSTPIIEEKEYFHFIDQHNLAVVGLGFVDVHLLASARLASMFLWSFDKSLISSARKLKLDFKP